MEPPKEPVSGEKPDPASASPRLRAAKGAAATTPKPAPARASPKTRAKGPLAKKALKAAQRPQKPLDTVQAAAEKEPERPLVDETATCSASQPLQPPTETPSPACPVDGAREQLSQPQLPVTESAQPSSLPPAPTLLPPESPSEEPAAKRAKTAAPEAAFAPPRSKEPEMTPRMRQIIAEAIAQGIAAGIQQHRPAASPASDNTLHPGQAPTSSMNTPESLGKDLPQSGDKGGAPDPHGFIGLFSPALFKALLQKAKATARIGGDPSGSGSASSDPNNLLFAEPGTEKEEIPCPKFFLDVVQRQWAQPGGYQTAGGLDKLLFNVAPNLTAALETPTVDGPVAALAPDSILFNDINALKPEDKKTEATLCKGYQSSAWAVKSAMAASFFNRTSLLWLRQIKARIPATDLQTHEDINNLIAAAEYCADASLSSAKFASRAIASSVTARRLLWLRYWKSDNKSKWKLACAPYKGGKLFGEALEPLLETKDKKKILPSTFKTPERKSTPYFQKPSFRAADNAGNFSQPQRAYFQRPDRQSDRPGYRGQGRGRQPFQSKRPFRGNGSRSFPNSSRSLHSQSSRGPEATGDRSPKGFEELENDSPPRKIQQTSGMQEIQNPIHTKERLGGRRPEVNRSHRSTATRPYVDDSPSMSRDMQREPPFPIQSSREDSSYTLGSPQDYPYSRPTVSGRHVDRIVLTPPRHTGPHHDQGPSESFRESGIQSQTRQEPLASYRQDAPPSSNYRDQDMRSLPVSGPPGQHQRSVEPDPIGPNGASRPRLTIVRKDGVLRLHCSRGTSGYQDPTMVPPAYPEIQQEQFNYRRPSPTRNPPAAEVTDRNQGMPIQGSEPFRDRYGRPYAWLENPDRDPDGRRGTANQCQPGRDPSRPHSPPRDLDERLRPPRPDPNRQRRQQGSFEPPREHPLEMYPGRRRQRADPS